MILSPSACSSCSAYRWHEQRLQSLERRPFFRRNHCHFGQRLSAVLTVATLRCCPRADRLRNAARESHASHRPQDTDFKLPEAAREARVVFCILCRGSSSKDAWPKSPEGVRSLGNTRDDVARSLMAALGRDSPEAAVVLVFEDAADTQPAMVGADKWLSGARSDGVFGAAAVPAAGTIYPRRAQHRR